MSGVSLNAPKPSGTAKPTAPERAPRAYVTKAELATCSSYMVGRLTVDKVNAALEDFAGAKPDALLVSHDAAARLL